MKNLNNLHSWLAKPNNRVKVEREVAARSLGQFVRRASSVVEPFTPFVPGWHIDAIVDHLEAVSRGEIRNLLINVPPRHMKSLLVSVFWPAWEWIRYPERRWLFSSYAAQLSIRDSVKCRRLIESSWYRALWGHVFKLTGDQNAKSRFDNDRSGYRLATSVGGSVTGEGGDRIVCDDPHKVDEVESDGVRKASIDWWDIAMSTRVNDPKTSSKVVVMQRCHQQDLSGHLLEQGGFEHLCLPAEYEGSKHVTSIGFSDPRTANSELLWPQRFGTGEIADLKRALGSYASAGQLQQRPSPAEGGMIKRHWFRFWQKPGANLPAVLVRLPDGSQHWVVAEEIGFVEDQAQSWDCSFKDLETSDYVVGQVWGRIGARFLLLDQIRERMDCPSTVKSVHQMSTRWPGCAAKLIEDKANGSAVIQMLSNQIPGIIAVNPSGGKIARASAISPLVEAGNVYLPHPQMFPWVQDLIEECAAFPNAAHDDQVDAMTQVLLRWNATPLYDVILPLAEIVQISPY
ncbi:MAG: phage terminase large subunit [Acidobacteriia bacterium]|nr:phage terminase large subunit [Terriglobia bacterium]